MDDNKVFTGKGIIQYRSRACRPCQFGVCLIWEAQGDMDENGTYSNPQPIIANSKKELEEKIWTEFYIRCPEVNVNDYHVELLDITDVDDHSILSNILEKCADQTNSQLSGTGVNYKEMPPPDSQYTD